MGRLEDAITAFQQALAVAGEFGDRYSQAFRTEDLAKVLAEAGRPGKALVVCLEAVTLFAELGDEDGQAQASQTLATIVQQLGSGPA